MLQNHYIFPWSEYNDLGFISTLKSSYVTILIIMNYPNSYINWLII